MKPKNVNIPRIRNIRDLSQCQVDDVYKIKKGKLIRSARIDKLSIKKRHKFINQYNIKNIIDLRNDVEINEGKEVTVPEGVNYHHISVLSKTYLGITHEKSMRSILYKESKKVKDKTYYKKYMTNMYESIVFEKYSQDKFKEFFDILLNCEDGCVFYNCAGGKDRTGIATLFVLTLLGVSKEEIIKDYALSDVANKTHNLILTIIIKTLLFPAYKFGRLLIEMLHARKEYLERTIAVIEEKYGSLRNYLYQEIDITDEKERKLKELFLEKKLILN